MTTTAFDISPSAVQWRASWHCQSGSLVVQPVRKTGPEVRPLVEVASCTGKDGLAYATYQGSVTLKVTASGPWQLEIEQQVDSPLVEDLLPQMASPGARVVASGPLYNVDHTGRGMVKIYQFPDGSSALRVEDFYVTPTADLQVRLVDVVGPKRTQDITDAQYKNVAFLKATLGTMNFALPADVDVSQYHSLVIWCELTHNAYAAAALDA